jgi:hypothetical protein
MMEGTTDRKINCSRTFSGQALQVRVCHDKPHASKSDDKNGEGTQNQRNPSNRCWCCSGGARGKSIVAAASLLRGGFFALPHLHGFLPE